jgi:hypothetical protein
MSADRAVNTYLYAIREHASEEDLETIEEALTPPRTYRVGGVPSWYGDDDDAWQQFASQSK